MKSFPWQCVCNPDCSSAGINSLRRSPNSSRLCSDCQRSFANTGKTIRQFALNGEFGNTRDASVHGDGTKSRWPKRVAHALRRRNSLRMAIQLWGMARSCSGFRDCTAHPMQKEETGGTAPLSSPSHIPRVHRQNSAHTEQSAETTFLTSPSQLPPI